MLLSTDTGVNVQAEGYPLFQMAGSENKVPMVLWSNFWFSTQEVRHTFEIVLHSLGSAGKKMPCFENPAFLFIIPFAIFACGLKQSIICFLAIPQDCFSVFQLIKFGRLGSSCFVLHLV